MPHRLYFDNNATTALAPEVLEAMTPYWRETYGNPSSQHAFGEAARRGVQRARGQTARLLGASSPEEIVFTSGGTESIVTALRASIARARRGGQAPVRAMISAVEHAAVSGTLESLAAERLELQVVPVDENGRVSKQDWLSSLESDAPPHLVSLQVANNELGTVQDEDLIERTGELCRERRISFHLDAVQVPGKLAFEPATCADLVSIAGHKFHGPKGVGALYVRSEWAREGGEFTALVTGGSQEDMRRAGTHNVPGIVGLGAAADLAREHVGRGGHEAVRALRDQLEAALLELAPETVVHARGIPRLPNTISVRFRGLEGELLAATCAGWGLALSTGAACSTGRRGPSQVLLATGLSPLQAAATVRLSLSRETTEEEVERALEVLGRAVSDLASLAPPGG